MPALLAKRRKISHQKPKKIRTGATQEISSPSQLLSVAPVNWMPLPLSCAANSGSTRVVTKPVLPFSGSLKWPWM